MFAYTSVQKHVVMTPEGKETKTTQVNVNNGKGTKAVIMKKNGKIKSKQHPLTKREIKNIRNHTFMPNLFTPLTRSLRRARPFKNTINKTKKKRRNA